MDWRPWSCESVPLIFDTAYHSFWKMDPTVYMNSDFLIGIELFSYLNYSLHLLSRMQSVIHPTKSLLLFLIVSSWRDAMQAQISISVISLPTIPSQIIILFWILHIVRKLGKVRFWRNVYSIIMTRSTTTNIMATLSNREPSAVVMFRSTTSAFDDSMFAIRISQIAQVVLQVYIILDMILLTKESAWQDCKWLEDIMTILFIRYNKNNKICLPLYYKSIMFKYIQLSDILKRTIQTKSQLKPQLYPTNSQTTSANSIVNARVAYSNLSLIINNISKFQQFYQDLCTILHKKKEKNVSNKYLLFVMVAEFFNVGKIKGGGKLKKIILQNLPILPDIDLESKINKKTIHIRLRKNCQNQQQLKKWSSILNQYSANQTIPNLFNLAQPEYSQLVMRQPSLRSTPACVVQSFSSNLPPFVLFHGLNTQKNKTRNFNVIDACAAPGNKTIQLAEYLEERGVVFAFQKDQRRYKNLSKNVERFGANNIQCISGNFLQAQPEKYKKVKLIMLDPSCSGSGMLINFSRDSESIMQQGQNLQSFEQYAKKLYQNLPQCQKQRISLLKKFQLQLLDHASLFKPQRISYSTCSIYCQQNQEVVRQFLLSHPQYEVKPIIGKINKYQCMVRGFGKQFRQCIRVDPRAKVSDGFFVAVFGKKKQASAILQ